METIVIMDRFMDFISKWDRNIKDDLLWPKIKFKLFKYSLLLDYDPKKYKSILKNVVRDYV